MEDTLKELQIILYRSSIHQPIYHNTAIQQSFRAQHITVILTPLSRSRFLCIYLTIQSQLFLSSCCNQEAGFMASNPCGLYYFGEGILRLIRSIWIIITLIVTLFACSIQYSRIINPFMHTPWLNTGCFHFIWFNRVGLHFNASQA